MQAEFGELQQKFQRGVVTEPVYRKSAAKLALEMALVPIPKDHRRAVHRAADAYEPVSQSSFISNVSTLIQAGFDAKQAIAGVKAVYAEFGDPYSPETAALPEREREANGTYVSMRIAVMQPDEADWKPMDAKLQAIRADFIKEGSTMDMAQMTQAMSGVLKEATHQLMGMNGVPTAELLVKMWKLTEAEPTTDNLEALTITIGSQGAWWEKPASLAALDPTKAETYVTLEETIAKEMEPLTKAVEGGSEADKAYRQLLLEGLLLGRIMAWAGFLGQQQQQQHPDQYPLRAPNTVLAAHLLPRFNAAWVDKIAAKSPPAVLNSMSSLMTTFAEIARDAALARAVADSCLKATDGKMTLSTPCNVPVAAAVLTEEVDKDETTAGNLYYIAEASVRFEPPNPHATFILTKAYANLTV